MLFSSGLFLFLFAAFRLFLRLQCGARRRCASGTSSPSRSISTTSRAVIYPAAARRGLHQRFLVGRPSHENHLRNAPNADWVTLASLPIWPYWVISNIPISSSRSPVTSSARGFSNFQNIFLPVGISFFLFSRLSYTIDIYRGTLKPIDAGATTSSTSRSFRSWSPARSSVPANFLVQIRRIPSPSRVKCPARASF